MVAGDAAIPEPGVVCAGGFLAGSDMGKDLFRLDESNGVKIVIGR